jgi:hypothetical protein
MNAKGMPGAVSRNYSFNFKSLSRKNRIPEKSFLKGIPYRRRRREC